MKRVLTLSALSVFVLAAAAWALPGKHEDKRGDWWTKSKIVEQLALSDRQKSQIEQIASSHKGSIEALRARLKADYREMKTVMRNPNSTNSEILSAYDRVESTHMELGKIKIEMTLAMREALSTEQRVKLFEIKDQHRAEFKKDC
ncbi:MAG: Spy/CpxP family protein refolding chaperone [Deltaproteobacteria bacterium]